MRTVVLGALPVELEELMARRRAIGADRSDEVWHGDYHIAPAAHPFHGFLDNELAVVLSPLARRAGLVGTGQFNLGTPSDYRVPDRGLHRTLPTETWVPTAALVVEVLSPDDESWQKLGFYAAHGVQEVVVVDGDHRRLTWLARYGDHYEPVARSAVLDALVDEVAGAINWPGRLP